MLILYSTKSRPSAKLQVVSELSRLGNLRNLLRAQDLSTLLHQQKFLIVDVVNK